MAIPDKPSPPPDTPAVRRYLARHPDALGLTCSELTSRMFRESCALIEDAHNRGTAKPAPGSRP